MKKLNEIPFPAYVSIIIKDGLDFDQLKAIGYTEIINFFCGQNEDNNWNNPLEFSWVGNYTGSLQSRSTWIKNPNYDGKLHWKITFLGNCVSKTYEISTFSGLLKSITKYKNLTDVIESFNIKTCDDISCKYSFHNLTGKRKYLVFVNFISTT